MEQIGLTQQGACHGHERETFGHGQVHSLLAGDPAKQNERQGQRVAELAGTVEQVGLLVGVTAQEPVSGELDGHPYRRRELRGELADRRVSGE